LFEKIGPHLGFNLATSILGLLPSGVKPGAPFSKLSRQGKGSLRKRTTELSNWHLQDTLANDEKAVRRHGPPKENKHPSCRFPQRRGIGRRKAGGWDFENGGMSEKGVELRDCPVPKQKENTVGTTEDLLKERRKGEASN